MKTLIAVPCMDMIPFGFMKSVINLSFYDQCEIGLAAGSLVYDARNQLAKKAVDEGFDRVLWLDSDMVFQPDLFKRLKERLDEGHDFVSGIYFSRKQPVHPVFYEECKITKNEAGQTIPMIEPFKDYPENDLFEIQACGFGGVMMNTSIIKAVNDKYGLPFYPILGFGEDLAFCYRLKQLGIKMMCDSSIKLGHLGTREITEETWRNGGF